MEKIKTTYVTIRIDYINHKGLVDEDEEGAYVADLVIEDALAHTHTIDEGFEVVNIENCGVNQ